MRLSEISCNQVIGEYALPDAAFAMLLSSSGMAIDTTRLESWAGVTLGSAQHLGKPGSLFARGEHTSALGEKIDEEARFHSKG